MWKGILAIAISVVLLMAVVSQLPVAEHKKSQDRELVSEVLDIMESNVLTTASVDWVKLKQDIDVLFNTEKDDLLYKSVYKILKVTNTGHSFYRHTAAPKFIMHKIKECKPVSFVHEEVPSDIGYVNVGGFGSAGRDKALEFIKQLREQIGSYNKEQIKGWIVDLSSNRGGNMWPMLAGIAPLLPDEVHGCFAAPDGAKHTWSTKNGGSYLKGKLVIEMEDNTNISHQLPIAVISSNKTASSGGSGITFF